MTNAVFDYNDPFRPIYEYRAIAAWTAAAIAIVVMQFMAGFHSLILTAVAVAFVAAAGFRVKNAFRLLSVQRHLSGRKVSFMTRADLAEKTKGHETGIFIGYGFEWTQASTQLVHQIKRNDPDMLIARKEETMGQPWIHGIGMTAEHPLYLPIDHTAGHTLLVGTTRAGKSRFIDTFINQAVRRGEAVIIWDPKGDKGLSESAESALDDVGRPNDYIYFHPAFPEKSWRIDPLKNFNRATELATRIAALIPSETGADPFTAHSMMLLTHLCEGLLMINRKPTLVVLKSFVDNGPEWLVVRACEAYFEKKVSQWEELVAPFVAKATGGRNDRERAIAYQNFYNEVVKENNANSALEGLFSDFNHDKQHQAKMTASLTPVLTMLTAGSLGPLLSPNPGDIDDTRPITDFGRIIRNNQVCYIGLDSLSDNMVGSAIGSMFVSDMTSVSGDRYNFQGEEEERGEKRKPVNLIIDEAAELVSDKMIQLLNKAGGSDIRLIVATQTFSDFAARVGSAEKARMVLGNLNNRIVLRTIDGSTQKYISEVFPQTFVRHIEYSQATDAKSAGPFQFGYRITESMKETEVPVVGPEILGCLPSLEFFAQISGGKVVKGRIPILVNKEPNPVNEATS